MNNEDYIRRLLSFEQAAAGMRPIASMLFGYFNALVESGFNRNEALQLTINLQDKIWDISLNTPPKNDEE